MALKPLQAQYPLGQFDGQDGEIASLLGGEVVGLSYTNYAGADLASYDVKDGYAGTTARVRPVVTKALAFGMRPLFLADEGIAGYGTLFGVVVGGTCGQVVTGGAVLGPHTTAGSGKVTCWDKPGLYAVTLDAVDTTANTGLVPGNASVAPGVALYATATGKLTPAAGSSFESGVIVGRFVDFSTNGSLVNTPQSLVAALNTPSGNVGSVKANQFTQCVLHFAGHLS